MRLSTAMLFDFKVSTLSRTAGTTKDCLDIVLCSDTMARYNGKGNRIWHLIFMLLFDRSLEGFLTLFHEISHFITLLMHMAKCQLGFHFS